MSRKQIADSGENGLLPAGKEFGVFSELEALRSLSVELLKADLNVEEAKRGYHIIKTFMKYGVSPEQHTVLAQVCKEMNDAGFIKAAIRLGTIEMETNMGYQEIMEKLQSSLSELAIAEKHVKETETKRITANNTYSRKKKELESLESKLTSLRNEFSDGVGCQ